GEGATTHCETLPPHWSFSRLIVCILFKPQSTNRKSDKAFLTCAPGGLSHCWGRAGLWLDFTLSRYCGLMVILICMCDRSGTKQLQTFLKARTRQPFRRICTGDVRNLMTAALTNSIAARWW